MGTWHEESLPRAITLNGWVLGIGVASIFVATIWSALNFSLRLPSRARIAEQFEQVGRGGDFDSFVHLRGQYTLATAIVRSIGEAVLWVDVFCYSGVFSADPSWPRIAGTACTAWLISLVFVVAIPASWAKYSGSWLVVSLLPVLNATRWLCQPLSLVLGWFDPLIRRLAGVPIRDAKSHADELEQEILHAVTEGELHGAVDEEEKEMIESVIELTDTRVEEIMTPRTDIIALPKDSDLDTVLTTIRENGRSRIPIYAETIDTICGVLYTKDLLRRSESEPFRLDRIAHKALFIPESKHVRDLLREFQAQQVHIAIVLDEYGGTAGLVTIEDIVEELVGEIADEYEKERPAELKRLDEHTVEVDARMRIDDLNDELNLHLPEDGDYETIGGLVFSTLGKIPDVGETCAHDNVAIRVLAAEARRVTRLRLKISPPEENGRDPA